MPTNSLAYIFDCLTDLDEQQRNRLVDDIVTPLQRGIAQGAGSREMIDVLMKYLTETDWDSFYAEILLQEQARRAQFNEMVKKKRQDYLDEEVWCAHCHKRFPRKETKQTEGETGRQFCFPCMEIIAQDHGYDCLVCQQRFVTFTPPKPGMIVCLPCKNSHTTNEYKKLLAHHSRARRSQSTATLTLLAWLSTLNHFRRTCAYCGGKYQAMEHYLPIELGGGTTATNCLPSCNRCNTIKKDKHPNEFEHLFPTENIARIKAYFASLTE